ncbi:MAG: hypothetical protein E7643_06350 [Ruminococcaceae bacterium]|nr:hypothetical protein [Oscillospiraceae bacterium]
MNERDRHVMAAKIRARYTEKEVTDLDELRALDARVKRPACVFAYIFGSIAAIIMGAGMSLVMTDIASILGLGDMMIPGVVIGCVGMILALINYPMYCGILNSRKRKYVQKILEMSDRIMGKENA